MMSMRNSRGIASAAFIFAFALGLQVSGGAFAQVPPPPKTEKDKKLYQKAWQTCNGPRYPVGAKIYINYKEGWFRCQERFRYR